MTEYESAGGLLYHNGQKFSCSCGNGEYKVEIGTNPVRYWCTCGELYTEEIMYAILVARGEA